MFHKPEASKGHPTHRKDTRCIQFPLCLRKNPTNFGLWWMVCQPFADGAAQVCSPIHTYAAFGSWTICERFANHSAYSCIRKLSNTGSLTWLWHIVNVCSSFFSEFLHPSLFHFDRHNVTTIHTYNLHMNTNWSFPLRAQKPDYTSQLVACAVDSFIFVVPLSSFYVCYTHKTCTM